MTDTTTIERAPWLEPHDAFEGVGAHELNPRYEHVDEGGDWDQATRDTLTAAPHHTAFIRAQSLLATTPIRLDGADLAHYQIDAAPIDWTAYAHACWFGMAKLTQSTGYLDPTSARTRQSMRAVAVGVRGVYHWLSSTTDPEQQAWWFLKNFGDGDHEFAALDDEENGVNVDKTLGWLEAVEAKLKRPSPVYSGAYVAGGTIWTDPRIREGKYGMRPMMLAAYTTEAKARALPGVATHPWHSWQFSSNGPVPGITGRCDMNRVDDRRAFEIAAGLTNTTPTPPTPTKETDMPVTVTNSQPRINEYDGQTYEPYKFVFVVEEGGLLRHVDGRLPEGGCYTVTANTPAFSNVDLDRWPKYVDSDAHTAEVTELGPMIFTGHVASIPGDITLTSS